MTTDLTVAETVKQLADRLGKSAATVWRWINTGVAVGERRVKLAARRVGGHWSITREAWELFDRECNPDERKIPESPTEAARRLATGDAAARKLLGG